MSSTFDLNWQKCSPCQGTGPIERSSHGMSVIADTLYIFGGENTARIPIDSSMYVIKLSQNGDETFVPTWRKIEPSSNSPVPRIAHSQAVIGEKIYIFGGRQGITMEESPLNDLHYFDVRTETWTEVQPKKGSVPSPRSFHQMVSIDTSLFIFGGCGNDGRMSDLYEFNTTDGSWTVLSDVSY